MANGSWSDDQWGAGWDSWGSNDWWSQSGWDSWGDAKEHGSGEAKEAHPASATEGKDKEKEPGARDKGPCLGKGNPQNPKAEVAKEKGKGATSKAKDPRFGLATKEGVEKLFGSAVLRGTKSSKKAPKPDPDAGANGAKVEEPRDPNEEDWEAGRSGGGGGGRRTAHG